MKPADLHPLQVGVAGLLELDCDVGFEPEHVRRPHLAFQVHQQAGIDPLELDQPRRQPEGAEPLGDGEPDLAGERGRRTAQGAVEAEGGFLHPLGGIEYRLAFRRQPDAVDMAGHQGGLVGVFQGRNPLAQEIGGHAQLGRRSAEAAGSGDCQENPDQVPVRHSSRRVRAIMRTPALT